MVWHGMAWHGMAWQGRAGQGRAGQGRAGQGRAGQGRAGQGRAGHGIEIIILISSFQFENPKKETDQYKQQPKLREIKFVV